MRKPVPYFNRRRFLRSTTQLGIASTLLLKSVVHDASPYKKSLIVRRDHLGNPVIPSNWREGPKSLDTPEFNPHGRCIPTISQIYRRSVAGLPSSGYGVMRTVVELKKPIGQLPEDQKLTKCAG